MDEAKYSNGAVLNDGDGVQLIRDLKVKGSSINLKRGTTFKTIRLTNKETEVGKTTIVLKNEYLKKS